MIKHKNGKNKPLYIGGQKYDGSKTVVVELAPDKSEYKNFFLTYIAGYDEYKLVFCPLNLEEMTPLETHIYSDEDCTVEIALITEIVEGTNDVKVLFPDGKQAIFLFSNTKETNGLVDFETMKDYVADYVAEHGGGGAIEQPLSLRQSPNSAWQQYDGTTQRFFETVTAFTKLNDRVVTELAGQTDNYAKYWRLFSVNKIDIINNKCKFYLQFGTSILGTSGWGEYMFDCFLTIDVWNNYYTAIADGINFEQMHQYEGDDHYIYNVQKYLTVVKHTDTYEVYLSPIYFEVAQPRMFNVYGNVQISIENEIYLDNFIQFSSSWSESKVLLNKTYIQTTPSGNANHLIYLKMGAWWWDASEIEAFKNYNIPTNSLGVMPDKGIDIGDTSLGAWSINGIFVSPEYIDDIYINSLFFLGNPNLSGDFLNNFSGLSNFGGFKLENKELNNCFTNITSKAINVGLFKPLVGNNFLLNSPNVEYIGGTIDLSLVDPNNDLEFFMGGNFKIAKINNFPRSGVFPEKIFKTWTKISLSSLYGILNNVKIFGDLWDLHVTGDQIDRFCEESYFDLDREEFIYRCWDELSVNIIVDE